MEAAAQEAADRQPAASPRARRTKTSATATCARWLTSRTSANAREREKQDFQRYALGRSDPRSPPGARQLRSRRSSMPKKATSSTKASRSSTNSSSTSCKRHGLKPITESGVRFDPNIHEAVMREEDPSVPSHTVVAVLQKGYFLHDRLLRPAMVKVAVGGPEENEPVGQLTHAERSSESISGRPTPASRSWTSPRRR